MAVSKIKRLELEQRRTRVAELYLKGMTQAEIALQLNVDQSTVSRDLAHIQKAWNEAAIRNLDEVKARELAKIDALERTYWKAWERSIGTVQIKTIKARGPRPTGSRNDPAPELAEQTIRTEELNGDPRYLEGVMACIERRCKLLGIDAPDKKEVSGPSGGPIPLVWDE